MPNFDLKEVEKLVNGLSSSEPKQKQAKSSKSKSKKSKSKKSIVKPAVDGEEA